jgi:hypothetical protein
VVSGGLSPLKGENMWTTSECLDLSNKYAHEALKQALSRKFDIGHKQLAKTSRMVF